MFQKLYHNSQIGLSPRKFNGSTQTKQYSFNQCNNVANKNRETRKTDFFDRPHLISTPITITHKAMQSQNENGPHALKLSKNIRIRHKFSNMKQKLDYSLQKNNLKIQQRYHILSQKPCFKNSYATQIANKISYSTAVAERQNQEDITKGQIIQYQYQSSKQSISYNKSRMIKQQIHQIKQKNKSGLNKSARFSHFKTNQKYEQMQKNHTSFSALQKNDSDPKIQQTKPTHMHKSPNIIQLESDAHKSNCNLSKKYPASNQIVSNSSLDTINYFAQTYKGKRPYNEDRYVCQTKNSIKLMQKFRRITKNYDGININNQQSKINNNSYCFFGVFDGHGGNKCSQYLNQNFHLMLKLNKNLFFDPSQAIKQTFLKIQQNYISNVQKCGILQTSGSCSIISLLVNNKIYIGNVGDSRAVLLSNEKFRQVTCDHKPDQKQQKDRIIKNGGKLYKEGNILEKQTSQKIPVFNQVRIIPGGLNVSRTIGDIQIKLKKYGGSPGIVIADPDIFIQEINNNFDHLILASDGLFQGLSNQQIHYIYKKMFAQTKQPLNNQKRGQSTKKFVKQLIQKSSLVSNDNITIICFEIPKYF